jgi:hypothetical protein
MKSNYIIYILILIVCYIIFLDYFHNRHKYNEKQHNTNDISYGHYSSIGINNIILYPSLILTSPIYITLKENESLIIPKYWWHWVTSNNQTIGINFWVKKDFIDYKKPEKISTSFQNNNLINDILFNYNEPVEVFYKSENGEGILIKKKINDLDLSIDNYLYTVPYLLSNKHKHVNTELHSKFEKFINIPDFAKNNDYEYNIWYSTGTHETGLHYDDNDNLLSVIKGTKNIILYPPSDSKYLKPYSLVPEWANTKAIKFEYNLFKNLGELNNSLPSSRLLYEIINIINNKKMLQIITSITKHIGFNKLVYGCKMENDIFRCELYIYHNSYTKDLKTYQIYKNPIFEQYLNDNKNIVISSFDLYNTDDVFGDEIHFYHNTNIENKFPYYGYGTKINSKQEILKESEYFLDNSIDTKKNLENIIKNLNFDNYNLELLTELINLYNSKELSIHNKYNNNYYIQYLDITFLDFINFLKKNNYPSNFINHILDNSDKYCDLKQDITIVFDKNGKVVRTAFYGLL